MDVDNESIKVSNSPIYYQLNVLFLLHSKANSGFEKASLDTFIS